MLERYLSVCKQKKMLWLQMRDIRKLSVEHLRCVAEATLVRWSGDDDVRDSEITCVYDIGTSRFHIKGPNE